ncbi:uncharacterized protein [Diadema antillarum]|uniref:uncharacterized protein n=1 Tax=Diadema antillarum TaxID=105358 RepID=UPI003A8A322F
MIFLKFNLNSMEEDAIAGKGHPHIGQLPDEIFLYIIIPMLPMPDLCTVRAVCREWHSLVNAYFARLKILDLTPWNVLITPEFLQCILEQASTLRDLRLDNCWKAVTDDTMSTAAERCREVRSASFLKCGKLTEKAVVKMAKCWKHLEELDLSSCFGITDEAMCGLAEEAASLKELYVGSVYGVTDYGVSQLAYKCPSLELLDVSYCHRVSNAGLQAFLVENDGGCPSLKHLRIKNCHKVNAVMIGKLIRAGVQVNNMF